MNVYLSPSSGYDNSYYDVQFVVIFDEPMDAPFTLSFFNQTTREHLEILATSEGYIDNNGDVNAISGKMVEGFINLFNDDKMNTKLSRFLKVNLQCALTQNNKIERKDVFFFNEAFSVTKNVLPFDLKVKNKEIDLSKDKALKMEATGDGEANFHLVIDSIDEAVSYDFFIFTKKGKMGIEIPVEVLHHELSLYKTAKQKRFRICYMKRHGVTYANTVNEIKIPIEDTEIKFSGELEIKPQTRFDPIGKAMSYDEFLLSDRYFVPTAKEYTFQPQQNAIPMRDIHGRRLNNELLYMQELSGRKTNLPTESNHWEKEQKRPMKENNKKDDFYSFMSYSHARQSAQITPLAKRLKISSKMKNMSPNPNAHTNPNSGGSDCGCGKSRRENTPVR